MSRAAWVWMVALSLGCVWPSSVWANGYENVPIGDRTAAMGGAGLAKGSDSAMPTLNPAGVARVANSTLSLSASAYQLEVMRVPEFSRPFTTDDYGLLTPSDSELLSTSFLTLASAFSWFVHLAEPEEEGWVLAAALTVPYARSRELQRGIAFSPEPGAGTAPNFRWDKETSNSVQETQYAINLAAANTFGPLRLGASLQLFYTDLLLSYEREEIIEDGLDFERQIVLFERSAGSLDTALMLGAQFDLTDRLSIGASARTPSLHLWGNYSDVEERLRVNNIVNSTTSPRSQQTRVEGSFTNGVPVRLGLGVEYSNDEWGLAADVTGFLPSGDTRRFEGDGVTIIRQARNDAREQTISGRQEVHERKAIVNINVGGFVALDEESAVRFGAFTDHSAVDIDFSRADGAGLFEENLDYYGVSGGYTSRLGPVETTFGLRAALGFGQTGRESIGSNLDTVIFEPTDARAFNVGFFVSGAIDTTLEDTFRDKVEHEHDGEGDPGDAKPVEGDGKPGEDDKPADSTAPDKDDKPKGAGKPEDGKGQPAVVPPTKDKKEDEVVGDPDDR